MVTRREQAGHRVLPNIFRLHQRRRRNRRCPGGPSRRRRRPRNKEFQRLVAGVLDTTRQWNRQCQFTVTLITMSMYKTS